MDKELPSAKMKAVENHLETCEACRETMKRLGAADHFLAHLPELEPSKDFDRSFQRKLSRLEEKKSRSVSTFFTFRWQPYFAAAMTVLIVAGFTLFHSRHETAAPDMEDILISENIELFQDFEAIDNLDLLENWEAIMALKEA